MRNIKRMEKVSQTAAQMFQLVDNINDYKGFLPWCSDSYELSRDDDEVKATIVVSAAGFEKSFTTSNRNQKNKMIEIRLVDGPFKHLEGFWLFEDLPDGGSTVTLDLEFEISGGGLLTLAFDPLFYQVAHTLVDAFKEEAGRVYA